MNAIDKIDAARIELMLGELRLAGIKLAWAGLARPPTRKAGPPRFLAALGEQEMTALQTSSGGSPRRHAAIDRLVHHATILEINADGYRRKEAIDNA
jgi:hypothetical protein